MICRGSSPFTHRTFLGSMGVVSVCTARLTSLGSYQDINSGRSVGVYLCRRCDAVLEAAASVSTYPYSTSIRPKRWCDGRC